MTQKELNKAILNELYKIADHAIKFCMKLKDGVYTAKEILDKKTKTGEKIVCYKTDFKEFDIQIESFKFHADTDNIFALVYQFETAYHIRDKRKFATSDSAKEESTITAKCVYYKKNGNDLSHRKKVLRLLSDKLAISGNEIYFNAGEMWYHVFNYYREEDLNRIINILSNYPDYFKNKLQDKINNNQYINTLEIELCEALGMDKKSAVKSRENFLAKREQEKKEKEQIRLKQEEERKQKELSEKKERLQNAEKDYLAGKKIASELFEELCGKYGLTLSPKQKGSLRERIVSINRGEYSFYRIKGKQDPKIDGIIKIAYELYDLIDENINKDQFIDITDPEQIKKTLSFGADESNTDIEKFLNGESVSFDQSVTDEQKPETFVTIDYADRKFDVDFTGKLECDSVVGDSFSELIEGLKDDDTKEIAYQELYKRAINYAHKCFSVYVKRVEMSYIAVDKLFYQLGIGQANKDTS